MPHTVTVRTEIRALYTDSYSAIKDSNSRLLYPKAFDVTPQYHDGLQLQHKCKCRVVPRTGTAVSRKFINRKRFWANPHERKCLLV